MQKLLNLWNLVVCTNPVPGYFLAADQNMVFKTCFFIIFFLETYQGIPSFALSLLIIPSEEMKYLPLLLEISIAKWENKAFNLLMVFDDVVSSQKQSSRIRTDLIKPLNEI